MDLATPPGNLFEALGSPTHCIHLAWPGLPNYKSDCHLLEGLPQSRKVLSKLIDGGLEHLLVTGTCLEYGMQEGELSEETNPEPSTPYAVAKDRLRYILEQSTLNTNVHMQWARLFYMYGPGQPSHSLFAQLQQAIATRQKEFPMSGGEQIRDYLPVKTVAEILVALAHHPSFTGIINVCSGKSIRLRDLVQGYVDKTHASIKLKLGVYPYPEWEPFRFWGSTAKLAQLGVTR